MSSSAIVDAIIDVLEADKEKTWNQDKLAQHILDTKQVGVKATHQIEIAIRTLVASGRLTGNMRGPSATQIKWRPAQDEAAVTALRNAIETTERLKQELESLKGAKPQDLVALQQKVTDLANKIQDSTKREEQLKQLLNEATDKYEKAKDAVLTIKTTNEQGEEKTYTETYHKCFKHLLKLVAAREEAFIWGPTGCGKTHICEQVAKVLNLPYDFVSCTSGMSESHITGKFLPVGDFGKFAYVMAGFVNMFENGGIFLLDEFDAADANVVLVINSALSNGIMALSNRPENPIARRHPDFVCIAAANTVGTGASRTYSGRNKLDMATLDRFKIGMLYMDYDTNVEVMLCPDEALRARLTRYRKAINEHGLERAMSTRFMIKAYKMKNASPDPEMCFTDADIDNAFFQGWREDEMNKVKNYR